MGNILFLQLNNCLLWLSGSTEIFSCKLSAGLLAMINFMFLHVLQRVFPLDIKELSLKT